MKMQNQKGITLIALIITIMILIMLAAVTIITMIDSGIIRVASQGAQNYQEAQYREKGDIQEAEGTVQNVVNKLKGEGGGDEPTPEEPDPPVPEEPEIQGIPITSLAIGDYVNYDPVNATASVPGQSSGTTVNHEADAGLRWRVWTTDNDTLTLISDRPTNYSVTIYSTTWSWSENTLLHQSCRTAYTSNSNYKGINIWHLRGQDIRG